jgi:hypothetical protein
LAFLNAIEQLVYRCIVPGVAARKALAIKRSTRSGTIESSLYLLPNLV